MVGFHVRTKRTHTNIAGTKIQCEQQQLLVISKMNGVAVTAVEVENIFLDPYI